VGVAGIPRWSGRPDGALAGLPAGDVPRSTLTGVSANPDGSAYLVVGAVVLAGIALFAGGMGANRLLRPRAPSVTKATTYESGVDPVGEGWAQLNVRYYLYAYLYVVFAVDAVYLFPWATVVEAYGWATVAEMGVFVGVLAVGLLHAWRRGVLSWR
jgi:NADH-quinone oxidoreductase subunit A